ncbi:MAG: DoxX family membrane protein [Pseudomonadota bacterium]
MIYSAYDSAIADTPATGEKATKVHSDYVNSAVRISLGTICLLHGPLLKGVVLGLPSSVAFFESVGLPGQLAYLIFAAEGVGGLLLLLGIWPGILPLGLLPISVMAALLGDPSTIWMMISSANGWGYAALATSMLVAALLACNSMRAGHRTNPGFDQREHAFQTRAWTLSR